MKFVRSLIAVAPVMALFSAMAFAQSNAAPRSTLSFTAGAGSSNSTTGVALGGSWLFDVNDRAAVEAQGIYLDRGAGADAMSVNGSLLVNLVSARARLVPYAALGGGLYYSSFDLSNAAFLGASQSQFAPGSIVCPALGTGIGLGPGFGFGPGTGTCPSNAAGYWGVGQMPAFYGRRLGPMTVPASGPWHTRSFTDPAVSVGGGLRVNLTDHLMMRPDVRALIVFAEGDTYTLGVYGIQFGYRF
jgi:hypothetical protein